MGPELVGLLSRFLQNSFARLHPIFPFNLLAT